MKISQAGIDLIKSFEGLRLVAYKPVKTEKYYTIGYGHYGADVYEGMTITAQKAEEYLNADVEKFEGYVNSYVTSFKPNQNQFDALVSFAYNLGLGGLLQLTNNRTERQVAEKIPAYVYAGGKKLEGLVKRRLKEQELFLKEEEEDIEVVYYDWTTACPEWSIPYVQKALDMGYIKGDEQGRLRLTDDRIWALVVSLRINGIMK